MNGGTWGQWPKGTMNETQGGNEGGQEGAMDETEGGNEGGHKAAMAQGGNESNTRRE